jgi:hypothetical protein
VNKRKYGEEGRRMIRKEDRGESKRAKEAFKINKDKTMLEKIDS